MADRESRNQLRRTVTDAVTAGLRTQADRDGHGYWDIDSGVIDTREFCTRDLAAHVTDAVTAAVTFETVRIVAAHPDHPGQLRTVVEFREAVTAITTRVTGSRTYLAGSVTALVVREGRCTGDAKAVDAFTRLRETLWVEVATTTGLGYVRIQEWTSDQGTLTIVCSQAARIGYARIDDRNHELTLVEPDQPAPFEEWCEHERARAIRDLCAHWPHRPATILVGPQLVPFDPWAPEFLKGAP